MPRSESYKPIRYDLPIGLHTWLYFVGTFLGFVMISVVVGVGILWGVLTSVVIMFLSHLAWRSAVGAFIMKRFFTKSLLGFVIDIFRKRSILGAAEEMLSVSDDAEKLVERSIQRESRWLLIVPLLLLVGTFLLDLLLEASLQYFLIAEVYYFAVGLVWMLLCRHGRLEMLPLPTND